MSYARATLSVPQQRDLTSAVADELPVGVWVARAPTGEFLYANRRCNLEWTVIAAQETDDKVGNGHTVAARSR